MPRWARDVRKAAGPPRIEARIVAPVVAVHPNPQASAEVQEAEQESEANYGEHQRMQDGRT